MLMKKSLIEQRLDDLIDEGERIWEGFTAAGGKELKETVRFTQWTTSCLNLLDKLSISSNRFVREFESWIIPNQYRQANQGAALGVLKSARIEYQLGTLNIISPCAAVFDGLLEEAEYLFGKGYFRAAAVLMGAALEED